MSVGTKLKQDTENSVESERNEMSLPEGWQTVSLKDLAKVEWGNTNVTKKSYSVKGFTAFSASGPDGFLPTSEWKGDAIILSAIGARCGKCFFAEGQWTAIKNTIVIQGHSAELNHRFLFHYLNDEQRWEISGSGQPFITMATANKTLIPFPPLAEQRRIVSKLELLLGKVSSSQQRLARVPGLLKRFRQSVLAAACSGKLTADWRDENDVGPNELTTEIEIPVDFPPLPESWGWSTLESLCTNVVDCPHSTPKWTDKGKLCIRTTNFRPGILDLSEVRYVSAETFNERIERLRPVPGDIVYSREGGILGIACQIPPGIELCLGQRMMLLRVGKGYTATLLMHWLSSPVITRRVQELTGGSAAPHLNVRDIKAFPTPVPPLAEQQEIVRRVEKLFGFADQIEAGLKRAQTHVDRLTQSLLAKAFQGKLVPTEAELARLEGQDYEPASVLLERIKHAPGTTESGQKKASPRNKRSTKS